MSDSLGNQMSEFPALIRTVLDYVTVLFLTVSTELEMISQETEFKNFPVVTAPGQVGRNHKLIIYIDRPLTTLS